MHVLDWLILGIYIVVSISVGLLSKKESTTNLEEYFLAGRTLKGWQSGFSMAAAQFAADTPLLVTGLIATAGVFAVWRLWVYALAFLLLGFVLAASWRRANVITDAELTEVRYGQKPALTLRIFKALYMGTLFNCTVLAMVLLAATRIAEPFLTWNLWLPPQVFEPMVSMVQAMNVPVTLNINSPDVWIYSTNNLISILSICALTTFYSTTGGLRNVVIMDTFQFFFMMGGTAVFAWFVVDAIGGLHMLPDKLNALFAGSAAQGGMNATQLLAFTPGEAKNASIAILMVFAVQWIAQINADGSGYLAQRTMACRSDRDAKQAAVVFTVVQIILRSLLWLPIALGLLLIFPPDFTLSGDLFKATREATYVSGMRELLPIGVTGLMLTAMLTALGSTVDTHINWGASYWTNDIYKRLICQTILKREPDPKTLIWIARGCNLLILGLSLLIMSKLGSIQEAWQASLLLGAGLGGILILRWLWWRINAWAEIGSICATLVLLPFYLSWFPSDELRMLAMAVSATLVGIVVAYLKGPEDMERLTTFYLRARPPGFWGPVARAVGESPSVGVTRLAYGLGATLLAAYSVFAVLVGLGTWMVGSPVPAWFPLAREYWIATLLLSGVALTPLWWHLAFSQQIPDLQPASPVSSLPLAPEDTDDEAAALPRR